MRRTLFVLLALTALPLHANIGDSVATLIKRYGKPMAYSEASPTMPFGTLVFSAGGYQLVVYLVGDQEVGARVAKLDKTAFLPAEMKTIMDAESDPNSPWTPTATDDSTSIQWTRTADKASVLYDKDKHLLIFTSPKMAEANRAAQKTPAGTVAPPSAKPQPAGVTPMPPTPAAPAAPAAQ